MLYNGYSDAIRNIRERKNLGQGKVAARAAIVDPKMSAAKWSKYETGRKKLDADDLVNVLTGLQCTETELWQETIRLQKAHYFKRADEIREDQPKYGTSMAAGILQGLWALDAEALPPEEQGKFIQERSDLAASLSGMLSLVDQLKDRYWDLREEARRARADDEPEES